MYCELNPKQYFLAEKPLTELKMNTYFCRSVIAGHTDGRIFVDNPSSPASFYIVHSYGMSMLFGNEHNSDFNAGLLRYLLNESKERTKDEWLQASSLTWGEIIKPAVKQTMTRQNFKFDKNKYEQLKACLNYGLSGVEITETTSEMFEKIQGSVIPKYFWKNAVLFSSMGKGFSLIENGKISSTAFAAYVCENIYEIGIETLEEARGRGFAIAACSAFIDFCMANGFEPAWSCRLENASSLMLAQKLGFIPTLQLPYYCIPA